MENDLAEVMNKILWKCENRVAESRRKLNPEGNVL